MKRFSCGDVVPDCDARFQGRSDDEVLEQVAAHAAEAHGMHELPADVLATVRSRIAETP